jgi:soluble lytic murein transglycosylase-like protein
MATNGFSSLKRSVAYSAILCGALAGCASTDQQASKAELSPAQANMTHPATATAAAGVTTTTPGAAATTAVASASTVSAPNEAATALPKSPRVQTAISQSPHGNAPLVAAVQTPKIEPGQVEPGQISAAQDRMAQTQTAQPASQSSQAQVAIAAVTGATTANTSASAAYAPSGEPPLPSMVAIPTPNPSRPGDLAMLPATGPTADAAYAPIPLTPEMVAIQSVVPMPRPGDAPGVEATMVASAAAPAQLAALSYADSRPQYDYNFDTTGPVVIPAVLSERDNNDDSSVPPAEKSYISQLIQKYAKLYQVPEALIHRVVHRESRYDPKAYNNAGYFGLMQIKYNTAKSMGYGGPASGLFDAETNIKYAAKYLSGAWKVADNKQDDAVRLYARGYYYDAKNKGMMDIATGNY